MKQLFVDDSAKKNPMGDDTKYSRAIRVPQYEPSNVKPNLESVYDLTKYSKLIRFNKDETDKCKKRPYTNV